MRKLLNTASNNLGMTISAFAGVASIVTLVLAAFMRKPMQYDMLNISGVLALAALAVCVMAHHKKGNDWHAAHHAKYGIPKWSFVELFATTSSHRGI